MLELVQASGEHGGTGDEDDGKGGLHEEKAGASERGMIAGAASRAAQCFCRIGKSCKPSRSRSENNSRRKGHGESKCQYDKRRCGTDRKKMCTVKGKREQEAGGCDCDKKPGYASSDGAQNTFSESLGDDFASRGTQGHAYRGLSSTRNCASELEVRDIGAYDEQNQSANRQ